VSPVGRSITPPNPHHPPAHQFPTLPHPSLLTAARLSVLIKKKQKKTKANENKLKQPSKSREKTNKKKRNDEKPATVSYSTVS
jgi:hypothetical protein